MEAVLHREDRLASNDGIVEKTARIQEDHVQVLVRDDGTVKNISLIDKTNVHNNVSRSSTSTRSTGRPPARKRANRYDVTILVNGLPMVHVELKRRGVAIKEAFNQIDRYQRESFWADSGLFEYVQLFVISNGTPHQVLRQHHARPPDQGGRGRQAGQEADLEHVRVHVVVDRRPTTSASAT